MRSKSAPQNSLVTFLVGQPTAVATLLAEHRDDGTGKCRTCGDRARGERDPWPCTTYAAAEAARDLLDRR